MADRSDKPETSPTAGTNPNVSSHSGGINPSAPSTGTEGWGTTRDERNTVSTNDPEATRAGQMQGNLADDMTRASLRESERATTNKRPSEGTGRQPADLPRRTSASADAMHHNQPPNPGYSFRCSEAGMSDCDWEATGQNEDEVMQKIVEHARDDHGMTDWTDAMRDRARNTIRQRKAA